MSGTRQAPIRRRLTMAVVGLAAPLVGAVTIALATVGVEASPGAGTTLTTGLLLTALVLTLVLAVGVLVVLDRTTLRPIRKITAAAEGALGGDPVRAPVGATDDELDRCARALNALIAERERALGGRSAALGDSERYRSLVESSVEGIVTANRQGVIDFANRGLEQILGIRREEMIGREIWRYYDGGREQAHDIMARIREHDGSIQNVRMELLGKDRKVPILTSAALLKDPDGRELGTLGIFTDITPRTRLEAELKETRARLIQSMKLRALGDLVSGVAHEVNNPLMASTTVLHMMKKAAAEDETCGERCPNRARVDVLQRCNDRIARIVNHLRDFSRQTDLVREPLDVNVPVENALLITGQQLTNRQIAVERELTDDLPQVLGDANQLEQVVLNLISNARDAMSESDPGELRALRVHTFATPLDGAPAVAIEVTDTGPGIPEEVREKMFEPFFSTKGVGEGTGLGLSISFGIVEAHAGRIDVESEPGEGTTFRVLLPATGADAGGEPAGESEDG